MTDITGFRLYQDTRYVVHPWPFAADWRAVVAELPATLPGGVGDFAQFCPDDHYNRQHGPIAHAHSAVRTEMAVYRDGEALVVLMRLWDGTPLPERFARKNGDGACVLFMADRTSDEGFYIGTDPDGGCIGLHWDGLQADSSATAMHVTGVDRAAFAVTTACAEGCWVAGFHVPLTAIPGIADDPHTVAFTCGRLWGEDFEHSAWATSLVWAPQPAEMGLLALTPGAEEPHLHRADIRYDAECESGELCFTLAGGTAPVTVTIYTQPTSHDPAAVIRQPWTPCDGSNDIVVKVGEARSIRIGCEKWSGHRLFVKYPSADPLPAVEELDRRFAAWHAAKEGIYVAPGTWATYPAKGYGVDHHCAFVMEPYALACLYLDRREIYQQRVREACDRLLREQDPAGLFLCYHFGEQPAPFEGGAFAHGSASEALCLGYRVFGDSDCLEAAIRAAGVYHLYALENNTNYMAFVLWHLAELFEITRDQEHLDRAIWYARYGIIRGMNPSGAHPGHNYYTAYGGITLKGMAKLLRMLPAEHEFYPVLRERVLRFTNQMLSRQRVNGLFDGHNRMYFGYQHTVSGLFDVMRALPDITAVLQPAVVAMVNAPEAEGLDLALMGRYLVECKASV